MLLTGQSAGCFFNVKLFQACNTKKAPWQRRAAPVHIIEIPSGTA